MRGPWLAAAGLGLLGLATVLEPVRVRSESLLSALGSSLGGLRVVLIDALVLRADGARRGGDIDAAASLYRTALEVDPGNATAACFLTDVQFHLLRSVVDPQERIRWWRDLRGLLDRVQARSPESALLEFQEGKLILDALRIDADLAAYLKRGPVPPLLSALEHFLESARRSEELSLLGAVHVDLAAFLSVEVAAAALLAGDEPTYRAARSAGEELLGLRRPLLDRLQHLDQRESRRSPGRVPVSRLLEEGLETARIVARNPGTDRAREAARRYAELVFETRGAELLLQAAGEGGEAVRAPKEGEPPR